MKVRDFREALKPLIGTSLGCSDINPTENNRETFEMAKISTELLNKGIDADYDIVGEITDSVIAFVDNKMYLNGQPDYIEFSTEGHEAEIPDDIFTYLSFSEIRRVAIRSILGDKNIIEEKYDAMMNGNNDSYSRDDELHHMAFDGMDTSMHM